MRAERLRLFVKKCLTQKSVYIGENDLIVSQVLFTARRSFSPREVDGLR